MSNFHRQIDIDYIDDEGRGQGIFADDLTIEQKMFLSLFVLTLSLIFLLVIFTVLLILVKKQKMEKNKRRRQFSIGNSFQRHFDPFLYSVYQVMSPETSIDVEQNNPSSSTHLYIPPPPVPDFNEFTSLQNVTQSSDSERAFLISKSKSINEMTVDERRLTWEIRSGKSCESSQSTISNYQSASNDGAYGMKYQSFRNTQRKRHQEQQRLKKLKNSSKMQTSNVTTSYSRPKGHRTRMLMYAFTVKDGNRAVNLF